MSTPEEEAEEQRQQTPAPSYYYAPRESMATPLGQGPGLLRDIFTRARQERQATQEAQLEPTEEALSPVSDVETPTLASLLSPLSPMEPMEGVAPTRRALAPVQVGEYGAELYGPTPLFGTVIPREPGLDQAGMAYLVLVTDPATGERTEQVVPDPHIPYLFNQSALLVALQRSPLSRDIIFTLEVPVPEGVRGQWLAWGVRNLVYKSHETPGQPATLVFRGLTVQLLRHGRSNRARPGTHYLFFEFYAETGLESEPGKVTAFAYRARILTADLAELAQGARPSAVRGSIEFDAPVETHWPTGLALRQL